MLINHLTCYDVSHATHHVCQSSLSSPLSKRTFQTGPIVVSFVDCLFSFRITTFIHVSELRWVITAVLATSFGTDIIIAMSLTFYLHHLRRAFSADTLINGLIKYSLETGAITRSVNVFYIWQTSNAHAIKQHLWNSNSHCRKYPSSGALYMNAIKYLHPMKFNTMPSTFVYMSFFFVLSKCAYQIVILVHW